MSKILILVASKGKNLELARRLVQISDDMAVETEIISLVDLNLPLYSVDEEKNGLPASATELTDKIESARSLIFVAPEYNGLIPPVLNNAIAWISRSRENWRAAFHGKMAAIATHSGSGGAYALISMRQQLSYIGVNVLGRQILTNYNKELNDESARDIIAELIKLGDE